METDKALRGHTIRVLVADNTRIHTQLLADALKRDSGLEVVNSDPNSHALLASDLHSVDVLLISSTLDEEANRGLEVLRELRVARPELRAVVLLDSSKDDVILNAFRSGARGVFRRHESIETLRKCVRCIHQGQIWANSEEMSLALKALAASPTVHAVNANGRALLSKREQEVVQSLAEGLTNQEIAERLGLSQHTVKNYLFRVFDKLGVSNRIELLFMTLSESSSFSATPGNGSRASLPLSSWEHFSLPDCEKAAAEGLPVAQLALAQKVKTKNPLVAYSWYIVLNEQISRAKKELQRGMTPEQIVEAERRAAEWLNCSKKRPTAPTEARASRFAVGAASAAAD
jgi:two-component system, NarL family, nitrate/nitrite response regulator NarL